MYIMNYIMIGPRSACSLTLRVGAQSTRPTRRVRVPNDVLSREGNTMSAMQKFAWFNLIVIGTTLVVVLALVPFGKGALGGFGLLGLLGFGPFFFRRKPGKVLMDER